MRILEIILEDTKPLPKLRLIAGKWSWVLPDTSVVGSFNSQREAMDAAQKNPSMLEPRITPADKSSSDSTKPGKGGEFKVDPNRRPKRDTKPRTPEDVPKDVPGVTDKKTGQRDKDIVDKFKEKWGKAETKQKYDDWANSKEGVWKARLGKVFLWAARTGNFILPIAELYSNLAKLELDFIEMNKPFTGDLELDKRYYNAWRNEFFEEFFTGAGAVIAGQVSGQLVRLLYYTTFIRRFILGLSAGLTWGVGLLAGITLEGMILWAQTWLQTPEGQKWLREQYFEPVVRYGATAADGAWQSLVGFYRKAFTGDKFMSGEYKTPTDSAVDARNQKNAANKNDQGNKTDNTDNKLDNKTDTTPKNKPVPQPPKQKIDRLPQNIRSWNGKQWIVGGVPVTDENGNLEPGVEYSIQVKMARQEAKRKGLPDPLADLPAAPGETHPGKFID
jgi:hypothetical protein